MWQVIHYVTKNEEKKVGRPKQYHDAYRKYARLTAKNPTNRYVLRYVPQ